MVWLKSDWLTRRPWATRRWNGWRRRSWRHFCPAARGDRTPRREARRDPALKCMRLRLRIGLEAFTGRIGQWHQIQWRRLLNGLWYEMEEQDTKPCVFPDEILPDHPFYWHFSRKLSVVSQCLLKPLSLHFNYVLPLPSLHSFYYFLILLRASSDNALRCKCF